MSKTVDYDDSSDDEVCFGEYTLKEAKRDLKKYTPRIPNRRHTTFLHSVKPNTSASSEKDVQQLSTCLNECLNISTTPSDYVTADETASTNKEISDGNFVKELKRIINEPCSKESSYNTARDYITMTNSLTEELYNTIYPENSSNLDTSIVTLSSDNPNGSIIVLSDDSLTNVSLEIKQERDESNSLLPCSSYREHSNSKDNVDHTNSLCEESQENTSFKNENNITNDNFGSSVKDTNNLLPNINFSPYTPATNKNNYNWNVLSKISERTEQPTFASDFIPPLQGCSISTHDYRDMPNKKSSDEGCESSQHLKDFEIPEINLDQFNDTSNFDDTLEDMNRYLAEALEKDTEEKNKEFFSAEKISKLKLQLSGAKSVTKYKHSATDFNKKSPAMKRALFSSAEVKPKTKDVFKEPTKPLKKFLIPLKSKNMFLNVVSPVSVYINNTPKYSPIVKNSTIKKNYEIRKPGSAKKENVPIKTCSINDEIPAVIYKPSSYVRMTEEKGVNLPGSIKKLIKVSTLTKHNQKIIQVPNQSIERRLLEDELSIDCSMTNTNHDISVLTQKQSLIIKK